MATSFEVFPKQFATCQSCRRRFGAKECKATVVWSCRLGVSKSVRFDRRHCNRQTSRIRESDNYWRLFSLVFFGHCLVKCGIWTRALSETKDMFRCKLPGRSTAFFFNRAWFVHSAGQQVSGRCFLAPLREVGSPWQPDPEHWPGTETPKIHEIYTL